MKQLTILEEYILLSVYHLKENAYLISIKDNLNDLTELNLAIGSVFAPLDRLRRNGYLRTENGDPSPKVGGRAIKYYFLTDHGINALVGRQKVLNKMWIGFDMNKVKG